MSDPATRRLFEELAASLDIPESAYEKAKNRYKDLGEWFSRPEAHCHGHVPHIYPQGSFRLGTVTRPLTEEGEYDLDMGCRLEKGITKSTHSQKQVKELVRKDLEDYRLARGIKAKLEEKTRCWRLDYADGLKFHIDTVPSIPQDQAVRAILNRSVRTYGVSGHLADQISELAGAITDRKSPGFERISPDWKISNSKGYALWFESRLKLASDFIRNRASEKAVASIDTLPAAEWKTPLQRVIQILKRHRDVMYAGNPDSAPISIIITTLAASAYQGENDIVEALNRVLRDMDAFIRNTTPRVPNPVNPAEDFADKWYDPEYRDLRLEDNFRGWLAQARRDFGNLIKGRDPAVISDGLRRNFGVVMSSETIRSRMGISAPYIAARPKSHEIVEPARPWLEGPTSRD